MVLEMGYLLRHQNTGERGNGEIGGPKEISQPCLKEIDNVKMKLKSMDTTSNATLLPMVEEYVNCLYIRVMAMDAYKQLPGYHYWPEQGTRIANRPFAERLLTEVLVYDDGELAQPLMERDVWRIKSMSWEQVWATARFNTRSRPWPTMPYGWTQVGTGIFKSNYGGYDIDHILELDTIRPLPVTGNHVVFPATRNCLIVCGDQNVDHAIGACEYVLEVIETPSAPIVIPNPLVLQQKTTDYRVWRPRHRRLAWMLEQLAQYPSSAMPITPMSIVAPDAEVFPQPHAVLN